MVPGLVSGGLREECQILVVTCERKLDLLSGALGEDARLIDCRPSDRWYAHPVRTLAAYHDYVRQRDRTMIIAEPRWSGWTGRQAREWIRHESVINTTFAGLRTAVWCLYDRTTAPRDILRTHPSRLEADDVEPSRLYVPPERFSLPGDELPFTDPPPAAVAVAFTPELLGGLRRTVSEQARRAGMDRNLIASLVLSVSEIAANSVEHGAGHGQVTLWPQGDEFVCEVTDPGGGLDDPLAGYRPPEPESQRGYGLWISRQLCDRLEIRSSPERVRIRLYMSLR
ncbi:ATP-binding protein [Planomonospora sp. ID67723]|nr:ATP-binding protein [Planomonospora sp. ID67723]